jgi:sec-independent protein translocase protein TatC
LKENNGLEEDHQRQPLLEHLQELRKRIMWSVIVIAVGLIGSFFSVIPLFQYLVSVAPVQNLELNALSPFDAIGLYMKFALVIALVLALPFMLFQIWAFLKPALSPLEQRETLRYVPGVLIMFLLGVAFAYYIVFPMAFLFTERVTTSMGLKETYGVIQYFTFLFNIVMPVSLLFELPLVILFLTKLGILNPSMLTKMRKVAWFTMIVIATTVTPPDFISDILVSVPLIVLYEFSVMLSRLTYRKKLAVYELRMTMQE